MSDGPRSSQGNCPGAMVMGRKRVMAMSAIGSRDTPAPAGDLLCYWVTCAIQYLEEGKAPRKAMKMAQGLS